VTDPQHATIVSAQVVPGHDGQAEIAVGVRYLNGAVRDICFPHDAIGPVLDAAGISSIDQLLGQPWTILLGAHICTSPSHTHNPSGASPWT
jgi:hypothetical protein